MRIIFGTKKEEQGDEKNNIMSFMFCFLPQILR
jgi:hypothetical protein